MMKTTARTFEFVTVAMLAMTGIAPAAEPPDPLGIVLKPIPDKLVVLTFDDSPASHATIVAPILKSLGFGASIYVCDFDSFRTRKDWYMTFRQMRALNADGFEIGNHTKGHGSSLSAFLEMEDELAAHDVPKPTTLCWPMYQVAWGDCPALSKNGYTFGRGGHDRPYRPTVDHPFDVPSYTIHDGVPVETFVRDARQASQGRIVVFTFHGVPDMEHPSVGLEPATFRVMMQYLKDNHYKVIAMRDLAQYIDPIKALKLSPTTNEFRESGAAIPATEDKPYVPVSAKELKTYTLTVKKNPVSACKDMLTFVLPGAASTSISGTGIGVYVPTATDVTALAPTFTLSPFATAVPASGTVRDFTRPQTYTVTAQDGSHRVFLATVVKSDKARAFTWAGAESGNWSDGSKWTNHLGVRSAPDAAGGSDCILNFKKVGSYDLASDLKRAFQLNQLNLSVGQGNSLKLTGGSLAFMPDRAAGVSPGIRVSPIFEHDQIATPLDLAADLTVSMNTGSELTLTGLISGAGGLILNGTGPKPDAEYNDRPCVLRIDNPTNTYSGGTIVEGGQLFLFVADRGLGTGPVTLGSDGRIRLDNIKGITNPLRSNAGLIDGGGSWNAPITLTGNTSLGGHLTFNELSGGMSGPGGVTLLGCRGPWGWVNEGWVQLCGTNTYTGPTIVLRSTLVVKKAAALYDAQPAQWTAEKIRVAASATLKISAGGPGEFTGPQVGQLLKNLTTSVNNNGLMRGSFFCLDTSRATDPVTVSADIADSKGPGGGALILKKQGAGTLQLSGANTFSGQTIVEGGTLGVASLNRVVGGQASSNLGAPTDPETGTIELGGDCGLAYTGRGEVTDRIMDFTGEQQTVTLDQSGSGLLKFVSPLVFSGYGHPKTIVLTGSTAGSGEIAGNIANPHDRKGAATTSLTKMGTGVWTLSGMNTYTGPTTVAKGILSVASAGSLGPKTDVIVEKGAMLDLNFHGRMKVRGLSLGGQIQPPGEYSAARYPRFIRGAGILSVQP